MKDVKERGQHQQKKKQEEKVFEIHLKKRRGQSTSMVRGESLY